MSCRLERLVGQAGVVVEDDSLTLRQRLDVVTAQAPLVARVVFWTLALLGARSLVGLVTACVDGDWPVAAVAGFALLLSGAGALVLHRSRRRVRRDGAPQIGTSTGPP
jgi:hypothetical protein